MNPKNVKEPFIRLLSISNDIQKLNFSSTRMDIISIFVEICLSTKLFKNNPDLKPFIDVVFNGFVKENLPDYLYKSRTQLLARCIRILKKMEDHQINIFYNRLLDYKYDTLEINDTKTISDDGDNVSKENDDFLDYWSDVINNFKI